MPLAILPLLPSSLQLNNSRHFPHPHVYRHHCPHCRTLNDFALEINPSDLTRLLEMPTEQRHCRERCRELINWRSSDFVQTKGKDGFQVSMDVQQFLPNEISVKTIDNHVMVEGKHEERQDEEHGHGFVSRQFTRRYSLPKDCDHNSVSSTLSSDGVLTIVTSPQPKSLEHERNVSIQQTGPAHLNVKKMEHDEAKERPAVEAKKI